MDDATDQEYLVSQSQSKPKKVPQPVSGRTRMRKKENHRRRVTSTKLDSVTEEECELTGSQQSKSLTQSINSSAMKRAINDGDQDSADPRILYGIPTDTVPLEIKDDDGVEDTSMSEDTSPSKSDQSSRMSGTVSEWQEELQAAQPNQKDRYHNDHHIAKREKSQEKLLEA